MKKNIIFTILVAVLSTNVYADEQVENIENKIKEPNLNGIYKFKDSMGKTIYTNKQSEIDLYKKNKNLHQLQALEESLTQKRVVSEKNNLKLELNKKEKYLNEIRSLNTVAYADVKINENYFKEEDKITKEINLIKMKLYGN